MDDVTDTVFRQVVASTATPDLFFTEFVNVDGLQSPGREKLLPKLQFTEKERSIIAQVWGKSPDNYYKTALDIVEMGYDGLDINMGCPDKAVQKNGCCVALIDNRPLAVEIIQASREGLEQGAKKFGRSLPLSVKTRLGRREIDFSWHELLLQQKLNMLTIHGRTASEMSKVPVHWDAVDRIRELRDSLAPDTLIVGNGDVLSRTEGLELAKRYKLDGIMIGRGVFHDPYVFAEASPFEGMTKQQKIALYRKHVQLFADTWKNNERKIYTLNKFCKVYINGFNGAKELREQFMTARSANELLQWIESISA
jgi:tRNA-dihydrouridine synthase